MLKVLFKVISLFYDKNHTTFFLHSTNLNHLQSHMTVETEHYQMILTFAQVGMLVMRFS